MRSRTGSVPPCVPGSLLFGSARDLQRDQLGTYERAMRAHGDVVRFRIGPPRLGFEFDAIFDPDGARHVLSSGSVGYVKDLPVFTEVRRFFGEGLATSEGERWRRHRRILQPLFTKRRVAAYVPIMSGRAQHLADSFRAATAERGDADLYAATMPFALDAVGATLFGSDMADASSIVGHAVPLLNQHAARRGLSPVRVPASWPTPANRAARQAQQALSALVERLVRKRVGIQADDLLGRLVEATDPETGEGMSTEDVRDEVLIFLVAGYETTASVLAFTLYLLGAHPEVQERARREVKEVIGERAPAADDVQALTYTTQVIDEALRLYPPLHTIPRRSAAADELHGHPIPAGHIVAVSTWGIHRNPKVWTDPHDFRPERFEAAAAAERDRYAFLAFGGGPRTCIGLHFARTELAVAVATLLTAFRIRSTSQEPDVTAAVTISPRDSMRCAFEPLPA